MKNYVYIYHYEGDTRDVPEEAKATWADWFHTLGDNVIDSGNPFSPGGKAVIENGASTVENGPAIGYAVIQARSLDEAVEMAKACPLANAPGGAVHIYETSQM